MKSLIYKITISVLTWIASSYNLHRTDLNSAAWKTHNMLFKIILILTISLFILAYFSRKNSICLIKSISDKFFQILTLFKITTYWHPACIVWSAEFQNPRMFFLDNSVVYVSMHYIPKFQYIPWRYI